MKSYSVTIQMKATEQYFPVVLFDMYKVVLTFESSDEILRMFILIKVLQQNFPLSSKDL